jgi:ribosome-associated protein
MPLVVSGSFVIPDSQITEQFVRASGPGGQNVNKVSTAVRLRFDVAASSLPADVKARLRALAGSKLTDDGVLLIEAREHRTQGMNREAARERLADLVRRALRRPRARRPTRPTAGAREKRLDSKHKQAALKRARSRPGDD